MVSKNKKILIILFVIVAAAAFGGFLFVKNERDNSLRGQSEIDRQLEQQRIKENAIERGEESENNQQNPSTESEEAAKFLKIYTDETNATVVVQTSLNNTYSWRSCTLAVTTTDGSELYSSIADIIYQEPHSICAGFSINSSQLRSTELVFKLTATTNDGKSYDDTSKHTP